jgi:hypothetical protein
MLKIKRQKKNERRGNRIKSEKMFLIKKINHELLFRILLNRLKHKVLFA